MFAFGAADRLFVLFGLSYNLQLFVFRIGIWVIPAALFVITRRWCRRSKWLNPSNGHARRPRTEHAPVSANPRLSTTIPDPNQSGVSGRDAPVDPGARTGHRGSAMATLRRAIPRMVGGAAAVTFALRLQPSEPGWVEMALGVPLMSTDRARAELGWSPQRSSLQAISELVAGMRDGAQDQTAPLARATSGPARVRELLTGFGKRQ